MLKLLLMMQSSIFLYHYYIVKAHRFTLCGSFALQFEPYCVCLLGFAYFSSLFAFVVAPFFVIPNSKAMVTTFCYLFIFSFFHSVSFPTASLYDR